MYFLLHSTINFAAVGEGVSEVGTLSSLTINSGLVAHYPFNGNANDVSGNENNGTVNGATQATDRFGNNQSAYFFDGSDDYINILNSETLKLTSWTISCWVRVESNQSNGGAILAKDEVQNDKYNYKIMQKSNNTFTSQYETCNDDSDHTIYSDTADSNVWIHIVSLRNDHTGKHAIYINGEKIEEGYWDDTPCTYNSDLKIGFQDAKGGEVGHFYGLIDDIRIYKHALSENKVKTLYQLGNWDSNNFSIISGNVVDLGTSVAIENAKINILNNLDYEAFTNETGQYQLENVPVGYGYDLVATAEGYHPDTVRGISVSAQTETNVSFELEPLGEIDYFINELSYNPNQEVSNVSVGGSAHRYYSVADENGNPLSMVPVYVEEMPDSVFYSNERGEVEIIINSELVGSPFSNDEFTIHKVGNNELSESEKIIFEVNVKPRNYLKSWTSSVFGKLGVSYVNINFERGAKTSLLIKDFGNNTGYDSIKVFRQGRAGAGLSYEVQSPLNVNMGAVNAGAQAGVGIDLAGVTEDIYKFPYPDFNDKQAVVEYIIFADGNFSLLDGVLIRILAICEDWFSDQQTIDNAFIADSKGISIKGYGNASAGVGLGGSENNMNIGLGGGISGEVTGEFNYRNFNNVNKTQIYSSLSSSISGNLSAGISFSEQFPANFKSSELGLSGGIGGTIGCELGAEFVNSNFNRIWFSYLRGYNYGAGGFGYDLGGAQEEYITQYNFNNETVTNIVENATELPSVLKNSFSSSSNISLNKSTFSNILFSSLNNISDYQTQNEPILIDYSKTSTDRYSVSSGSFNVDVSATGEQTVSAEIGGGVSMVKEYEFLKEKGNFYNWRNYPTETYSKPPEIDLEYDTMVDNIIDGMPTTVKLLFGEISILDIFDYNKNLNEEYKFVIGENNSHIIIDSETLPDTLEQLQCSNWSWWGNSSNKTSISLDKKTYEIYKAIKNRAQELYNLEYGIGGFYQFEPYNISLSDTASLTIYYSEEEVEGINEADLGIYKENKEEKRWEYLGGIVEADSNKVTTDVTVLGNFTIAPKAPSSDIKFTSNKDTITADGVSTTTITSNQIVNNDSTAVEDGTLFTVNPDNGSIVNTDQNSEIEGVQVASANGTLNFEYQASETPGESNIVVNSVNGNSTGEYQLYLVDDAPPQAPVLSSITPFEDKFRINWEENSENDISGYILYFDNDNTGAPYEGDASIMGEPSPIDVGNNTDYIIKGLDKDSTYFFALKAYDISGNKSDYSNELTAVLTNIEQPDTIQMPKDFSLSNNYPNPFNPVTNIKYSIPKQSKVSVVIYNILGKRIKELVNEYKTPGHYSVKWNGTNKIGSKVSSGIYFYRIKAKDYHNVKKMLLLK